MASPLPRQNKHWSDEEIRILYENVEKHSILLKEAFKKTAKEIGRTPGAVATYWYTTASKKKDKVCFATIGYKYKSINRKNPTPKTIENTSVIWWKKFLKFLGIK